jgi:hypothetical protein
MNDNLDDDNNPDLQEDDAQEESFDEANLVAMVKKIQQHLVFLERKIDTLINQQPQGRSQGGRPPRDDRFSRPRRPFGHHRPDRGNFDSGSGTGHSHSGYPRRDRGGFDKPREGSGRGGFDRPREGGGKGRFFERKKRFFRPGGE